MDILIWENKDVFDEKVFDYLAGDNVPYDLNIMETDEVFEKENIVIFDEKIYKVIEVIKETAVIWEIDSIPINKEIFKIAKRDGEHK